MSLASSLYALTRAARIMNAATSPKKTKNYVRRSLTSWAIAKLTAGIRR